MTGVEPTKFLGQDGVRFTYQFAVEGIPLKYNGVARRLRWLAASFISSASMLMITFTSAIALRLKRSWQARSCSLPLNHNEEGMRPLLCSGDSRLQILPGVRGGSPSAVVDMFHTALDNTPVYCRSRKVASSKQMKNWLLALLGFCAQAIEHTPRTCKSSALNSRLDVGQLRSAHAGAGRVAALRHEAGDHAVKHYAVVKPSFGERRNALDMAGCEIRSQR